MRQLRGFTTLALLAAMTWADDEAGVHDNDEQGAC